MSKEYIEKEAALEVIQGISPLSADAISRTVAYCEIKDLPPADVKPVVRGEWKRIDEYVYGEKWQCTCCEETNQWRARFCPNCGAEMGGRDEGSDSL